MIALHYFTCLSTVTYYTALCKVIQNNCTCDDNTGHVSHVTTVKLGAQDWQFLENNVRE